MRIRAGLDYVTPQEISLSIGLSEKTIIRWIKQGRLPFTKPGRQYLIPLKAYKEFLQKHSSDKSEEQQDICTDGPGEERGDCEKRHDAPEAISTSGIHNGQRKALPAFSMAPLTKEGIEEIRPHLEYLLGISKPE